MSVKPSQRVHDAAAAQKGAAVTLPLSEGEYTERERANFGFLEAYDLALADFALQAERFCLWDACACLFKLRLFVERMAKLTGGRIFPHWNFREDLFRLLQRLEEYGAFGPEVARAFHRIRKVANTAVHHGLASREEALGALRLAHGLAVWFARSNGPAPAEDFPVFQEPRERPYGLALLEDKQQDWRERVVELEKQVRQGRQETEELGRLRELARTEAQMAQLRLQEAGAIAGETGAWDVAVLAGITPETRPKASPAADTSLAEAFAQRCREAEALMVHEAMPLANARWLIAEELREAGWTVSEDDAAATYDAGARPQAGRNLVLSAWPTYAGAADYVFFAGQTPVGVMALRPDLRELEPALEAAAGWSRGYVFQPGEVPAPGAPWDSYRVGWALAANGHDLAAGGLVARNLKKTASTAKLLEKWPGPPKMLG